MPKVVIPCSLVRYDIMRGARILDTLLRSLHLTQGRLAYQFGGPFDLFLQSQVVRRPDRIGTQVMQFARKDVLLHQEGLVPCFKVTCQERYFLTKPPNGDGRAHLRWSSHELSIDDGSLPLARKISRVPPLQLTQCAPCLIQSSGILRQAIAVVAQPR